MPDPTSPLLTRIRAALLAFALVAGWVVVYQWWQDGWPGDADSGGMQYGAGRVVLTVGYAVATILWIATIWLPRVRRALAPLEGGFVIGVAMVCAMLVNFEDDSFEGIFLGALLVMAGAIIVWSFEYQRTQQRRPAMSIRRQIVIVVGIAAGVMALLGSEALFFSGEYVDDPAGMRSYEVTRRIHDDGIVVGLQGSMWDAETQRIDAGYGSSYESMPPTIPNASSSQQSNISSQLIAQPGGELIVRLSALTSAAGGAHARLQAGTCAAPATARTIEEWQVEDAATESRHELTQLTLAQLRSIQSLRLLVGSGEPLAPVRCISGVDTVGLTLVNADAATFAARCVTPLKLEGPERARLRATSFQDASCGAAFDELVGLVEPVSAFDPVDDPSVMDPTVETGGVFCDAAQPDC